MKTWWKGFFNNRVKAFHYWHWHSTLSVTLVYSRVTASIECQYQLWKAFTLLRKPFIVPLQTVSVWNVLNFYCRCPQLCLGSRPHCYSINSFPKKFVTVILLKMYVFNTMFITAVCFIFLIKLRWPMIKSLKWLYTSIIPELSSLGTIFWS